MSASTDSHPEAARKADRKPRPFQFRLSTLMRAMAAIAAFCFLLRLTGGKTLLDNPLIACYAYYALAVGIVLLGKSMAASDDVQRGSRLVTIGTWLFIAPALATSLYVAGLLLVFSLGLLTGWFSPFD